MGSNFLLYFVTLKQSLLLLSQPAVDNGLTNVEVHPDERHYRHDLKIKGKLQIKSADQLPVIISSFSLNQWNYQPFVNLNEIFLCDLFLHTSSNYDFVIISFWLVTWDVSMTKQLYCLLTLRTWSLWLNQCLSFLTGKFYTLENVSGASLVCLILIFWMTRHESFEW